jgi:curved DNA-binding protein CbpA
MGRLGSTDPGQERRFSAAIDFLRDIKEPFVGETRAQELLFHADALIGILAGEEAAQEVLRARGLEKTTLADTIKALFRTVHLNPEGEHYTTLLLPRNVSQEEISRRWKSLMRLYHPDHHGEDAADMAESVKSINRAYGVLKDQSARNEYDRSLVRRAYLLSRKAWTGRVRPLGHRNPARLILPICIMLCCLIVTGFVLFEQRQADFYLESAFSSQNQDAKEEARVQEPPATKPLSAAEPGTSRLQQPPTPVQAKGKAPGNQKASAGDRTGRKELREAPASSPKKVQVTAQTPAGTQAMDTVKQRPSSSPAPAPVTAAKLVKPEPVPPSGDPVPAKASVSLPDVPVKAAAVAKLPEKLAPAERKPAQVPAVEDLGQEVNRFLARYIAAYEKGSIDGFMDCYSRSAVENDRLRYSTIRAAYQRNFENNAYRYTLREVRHEKKGELIVVTGSYEIAKSGGSNPSRGRITWTLQRENGDLRIARVDYIKQ